MVVSFSFDRGQVDTAVTVRTSPKQLDRFRLMPSKCMSARVRRGLEIGIRGYNQGGVGFSCKVFYLETVAELALSSSLSVFSDI